MAGKLGDLKDKAKSAVNKKLGISDSATLTKLKIGTYEVFLNPNQVTHSVKIVHGEQKKATIPADNEKASIVEPTVPIATGPESLGFELMLDGTGATGILTDIPSEIGQLSQAIFDPLADAAKRKNGITIEWGKVISFVGSLLTYDTTYTLFKPDGTPLRATVKLAFQGSSNITKVKTKPGRESNTTEIDIDAAKTIVNACNAVYNSPVAYIAVAKANKLTNVRKLKPGSKLTFPPKKD